MIGLFTRPVAFVLSGLMACAYWMAHGFTALLPVMNHGELAVLYCFVFLFISAKGSGIWSLDGGMLERRCGSVLGAEPSASEHVSRAA